MIDMFDAIMSIIVRVVSVLLQKQDTIATILPMFDCIVSISLRIMPIPLRNMSAFDAVVSMFARIVDMIQRNKDMFDGNIDMFGKTLIISAANICRVLLNITRAVFPVKRVVFVLCGKRFTFNATSNSMKRLLPFAFSFFIFHSAFFISPAQWVSIPDTNFGAWLNTNGYSACMQGNNSVGWQMDTSCPDVLWVSMIDCDNYNIKDLSGIQYFDILEILSCNNNQLSSLPSLPNSLTYLSCNNNQLSSLPSLPSSLTRLFCHDNHLTGLPPLPGNLRELDCRYNQLNNIPALPNRLEKLFCLNNQLNSLPALPGSLTMLLCRNNQLNSLPALPAGLTILYCESNNLSSLPELPDSLGELRVELNPLVCLPRLKRILNFTYYGTNITCLPNYGYVTSATPTLNAYPLCDLFNAQGCEVYSNLSGKVYFDANTNCLGETAEGGVVNVPVRLKSNGILLQQMGTVALGTYSFDTDTGSYDISADTTGLPFSVACPATGVYYDTITSTDSLHYEKDFALECKPGFDLAAWSIEGRFRPGDTRRVDIHVGSSSNFYGINCLTGAGVTGNVTVSITGPAGYVSPAPGALTPDNVSGNTLTYNIADFGTVDFNTSFNIMVQTDTTAVIGSTICFTVTVTPITGDDIPANNIQTHCFVVVAGWDPNDKQVYPLSDVDVNGERWLTYTINFQNTGTDTAIHIYITDTLDTDLDVSTFQLLAYSHQPLVQLKENAVRFNFPNIYLVDSNANEPLSHGYVQYKIKVKSTAPAGTVINNTAYIYFDFNAPVVTNTTSNTLAVISSVEEMKNEKLEMRIYPNPATNSVTISVDGLTGGTLSITDITGRKLTAVELSAANRELSTAAFANGIYFVTVNNGSQSATRKLVVSNP